MSGKKEKQKKAQQREEILFALPGFLNRLLLLLNSGLALVDAFCRIAEGYEDLAENQQNSFTRAVCRIVQVSKTNGVNVIVQFHQFARLSGVKELTRISSMLVEHMDKGTDLWEKLEREGEQLWQARKRLVLEKMRLAESKMSFPLGLLLIALLIVTAGPALMEL